MKSLFSNYAALSSGNDEMLTRRAQDWGSQTAASQTSDSQIAPHWQPFCDHMMRLGKDGVARLQNDVSRLLRENGVTYNIYNSLDGSVTASQAERQRLWTLDVVPLIIAQEEWRTIEAGVIQRAELFNLILTDIYGPQTLIKERLLPLELVYQDPGFLRACHDVKLQGNHQLILYAVDLARGPDNRMWVVGDKTQAPSGSGYALENRMVTSQVQQALFQENAFQSNRLSSNSFEGTRIGHLSGYFQDLQSTLARLAPNFSATGHGPDSRGYAPRIAVMTPGPHSETYFEHAYLAAYLGYTLVQGDDLSVYNSSVNLKALSGLQPVDTILRRVDDTFCDPLELRSDSRLGVTGLLESLRRNNVAVVNPLGSGLLENLGIMPFLEGIANHWLGEELILPMAATWWCGQQKELSYVLDRLDELIIKPVSPQFREPTILVERLSSAERAELIDKIRARPECYVGQERVSYSTAPTLVDGTLQPRPTILRSFALARQDDYTVMPGGLTRSAKGADELVVSNSQGGVSKDTWVLTQEPQRHVSLWKLQANQVAEAFHSAESLPSRAAENLFWVGRYTERTENSTRLLRTIFEFFVGDFNLNNRDERDALSRLLVALTQCTMTYPGFVGEEGKGGDEERQELLQDPLEELLNVVLDPNKAGSLHADLRSMINAAYAVRNLWSVDSWRVMQELRRPWVLLAERFDFYQPNELPTVQHELSRGVNQELNQLMTQLMALVGLYSDSMTRSAGWTMIDLGRRLERALRTISFIRSTLVIQHAPLVEHLLLEAILKTTDNTITYRRRYRSHLQIQTVLDLLLLDDLNPRSLIWQFDTLQEHLEKLPRTKVPYRLSNEEQLLLLAKMRLQLCDTAQLVQTEDVSFLRQSLDALMADLTFNLTELSNAITQSYFIHTQLQQPFGAAQMELME